MRTSLRFVASALAGAVGVVLARPAAAGEPEPPEFPPFAEVSKDYEKVVSTADGLPSLYTIWVRKKDGQMLAELPRGYETQRHFIAMTVAGGETYAGLQVGDQYAYWKRFDKRLALIEPNVMMRSLGDAESKSSVQRLFTDKVLVDVPILCMGPSGQPVIDMDALLVGGAQQFFGPQAAGANVRLATIAEAKAYPYNVELAFAMPVAGGQIRTFHYSISLIPENTGYVARKADERVGYFTTIFQDMGNLSDDKVWVRYINRWKIEKADAKLKLSPPKEPIVFYIEHTTPVRYRRWVREGILRWNKAFEKIGISNAIEVYYQDAATGAHMDKDPEDVRFNFVRWLSNNQGTAIGPSRVDPRTGQILDADIILTDGFIRSYWIYYNQVLPELAMESFGPETLEWLAKNPEWDPRVRLAPPGQRDYVAAQISGRGVMKYGGHPAAISEPTLLGDNEYDGLGHRVSQINGQCAAGKGMAMNMALLRMDLEILGLINDTSTEPAPPTEANAEPGGQPAPAGDKKDDKGGKKDDKGDVLDGVPEGFVGPLLAEVVSHEVGHTLGLRHNFKASTTYTMDQVNSDELKGKKTWVGSVMDYNPVNIRMESGKMQGDYAPIDIGPYDYWAIEYGYTSDDPAKVLARVAEPGLQYGTDEDTWGGDPTVRRFDLGADPIEYAKEQVRLAQFMRGKIVDKFVKDGQSWSKARRGYGITLGQQTSALSMMSNWVGGARVWRDKKGDPNGRTPIEPVPAAQQRAALEFVIKNSFYDEAYGLTPDLLAHMTVDKWYDDGGQADLFEDPAWPLHDRIVGVQAAVLTMLMNPQTLQRVYDNEYRVAADQDALTLPELLQTIEKAAWSELDAKPSQEFTARKPMISSLRRDLQREHVDRLISLTTNGAWSGASAKPVTNLVGQVLRDLKARIDGAVKDSGDKMDPYSRAHLAEAGLRIGKALDAQYVKMK